MTLVIDVVNDGENVNNRAFNAKSLLSIGRPTELRLGDMTYINETVFKPFLLDNPNNKITLGDDRIVNCTDCDNYWIRRDKLDTRVTYVDLNETYVLCDLQYKFDHC